MPVGTFGETLVKRSGLKAIIHHSRLCTHVQICTAAPRAFLPRSWELTLLGALPARGGLDGKVGGQGPPNGLLTHPPAAWTPGGWPSCPRSLLLMVLEPSSSRPHQREARGQQRGLPLPLSVVGELMQEKEATSIPGVGRPAVTVV